MSFRVVITDDYTEMKGTRSEILAGLSCYIQALIANNTPRYMIDEAIKCGFMSDEELEEKDKEIDKKIENFIKMIFR